MRPLPLIVLLLLLGGTAKADNLPDAPVAKAPVPVHKFYDRLGKVELGAALTVTATDSAITCHNLANGGREMWQPTQSCAGNVGILFGGVLAQEGLAYGFHRLRWHKAERLTRLFTIQASTRAIWYSARHGGI